MTARRTEYGCRAARADGRSPRKGRPARMGSAETQSDSMFWVKRQRAIGGGEPAACFLGRKPAALCPRFGSKRSENSHPLSLFRPAAANPRLAMSPCATCFSAGSGRRHCSGFWPERSKEFSPFITVSPAASNPRLAMSPLATFLSAGNGGECCLVIRLQEPEDSHPVSMFWAAR